MILMRCEEARDMLITDYADKEMTAEGRRRVEEHMASCPACREFFRFAEECAGKLSAGLRSEVPPAYIWERIRAEARSSGYRKSFLKPALAFAAAAAAAVVLVIRPIILQNNADEYLKDQAGFLAGLDVEEQNNTDFFDMDVVTGTERII